VIDLTSLKSPGWQRVVAELSAECADDREYLERLMRAIARVSAARQACVFVPGGAPGEAGSGEVRALGVWPIAPGAHGDDRVSRSTDQTPVERAGEARQAAWAAIESGQARAFGLDAAGELYEGGPGTGYLLAVPIAGETGVVAAITLLVEPRSKQAVQSTLAMAEVLAGYVSGHASRQMLRRVQVSSLALDLATRLIAGLNAAPSFKGASMQLVNDLTKALGADRAALGWVDGEKVRAVALSDTEMFDRRMAMAQKLEAAMDECLDQEQAVVHPPPSPDQDVALASAIAHCHRELAGASPGLKVCSLPLREGEKVIGVLTLESGSASAVDPSGIATIQAALDLVAPVLSLKRRDDRWLWQKAGDSARWAGALAVGPKHTVWKLAGVALIVLSLFVTFFQITYRVGADAFVQPQVRQIISAPFDGVIARVGEGVEAGAKVREGDVLFELDTTELLLSAQDARQKIAQASTQRAQAMAEGKTAEAQRATAQIARSQADLDFAERRIRQAKVLAPMAGTVTQGRLNDRVGAAVKLGERLFEIAPLEELVAVLRVDERDIGLIKAGAAGYIATRSNPDVSHAFRVETIVPLAEASEGKNIFEVRGRVENPAGWMRPGMEGVGKVEVGPRSLLWIGTRRVAEALRLWLW
jgi:multidrug resistance efflux pump